MKFFILANLMPNLIPNFIKKIEFESNFKVVELEFELEPCDIGNIYRLVLFFHDLNPLYLLFFNLLKIPKYLKNPKILNRGTVRYLDKPLLGFVDRASLSPIHPQRCPKRGWFSLDLKN